MKVDKDLDDSKGIKFNNISLRFKLGLLRNV